ncbi:hypothetical protein SAMN02745121_01788 [Nannocystis exedens]|uniref:SIR2-like domain-containing protein n=1 Tax=Nannocystis exedens TaxID=54 RepID=A0A1I1VN10_9BACT|nr:hypothetical protein [Nannocystis exedens]PCC72673.1 hypothetical protein NAEX_05756 [Nannocystis exedens]SFD84194.1 hypothetical protein SAMN02745121_01788 [Nannocystis exedens]
MSVAEPEEWGPEGLCEQFWDIDRKMHNRRFAFILGAGASVQSGIPAAGALVWRWLGELHRRLARGGVPLERWATAEALEIRNFSLADAAAFYSQVFARRFRQHPDEGYADLEDIMQGKDPSFGYSVLAHILAETRHKLVITTNFDNLVGEALSIFTGTAPLVCGHESLANFVHVEPRRPVVVKIHRDLLMAPMNHAAEIAALQTAWIEPLTRVFRAYTPIVIGYGGNDGSLMGFLNGLPEDAIPGGIFWCYYGPAGPPGPEIRRLVARHRGVLVPIEGFDELMLRLSARLRIPLLDQVIETKARARVDNYRRRVEELQARLFPPALAAAEATPGEQDRADAFFEPVSPASPPAAPPVAPREPASAPPQPLPAASASPPPPRRGLESAPARPAPALSTRSSGHHADGQSTPSSSALGPHGQPVGPREDGSPVPRSSSPALARHGQPAPVPPSSSATRRPDGLPAPSSGPLASRRDTDERAPASGAPGPRPGGSTAPPVLADSSRSPGSASPTRSSAGALRGPAAPGVGLDDDELALRDPGGESEAEPVPSGTSQLDAGGGVNRRPAAPPDRADADDAIRSAHEFEAAAEETAETRPSDADGPVAPRSWTTGPLQRLPAAARSLQRALQQVAGEAPAVDPWTISLQARAEPDRERAVALLRAGLEQFPGDRTLSLDLVERLTDPPTRQSVGAAIATVTALLAADPDDKLALAHHTLLLAWLDQFAAAGDALRRLRDVVAGPDASAMEVAGLAFLAGLLLRLQGRDDSRALASFQVHVHGTSPIVGLPSGLIADLARRLGPDSRRLYLHLAQRLAGSLTADQLAEREPRLAELPPFDPATLDAFVA